MLVLLLVLLLRWRGLAGINLLAGTNAAAPAAAGAAAAAAVGEGDDVGCWRIALG